MRFEQPVAHVDWGPAERETVGGYGAALCRHPGCTRPARYKGYCYAHWKEAPMSESPIDHTPATTTAIKPRGKPLVPEARFREVCARAASVAAAAEELSLTRESVRRRCDHLDIPRPGENEGIDPKHAADAASSASAGVYSTAVPPPGQQAAGPQRDARPTDDPNKTAAAAEASPAASADRPSKQARERITLQDASEVVRDLAALLHPLPSAVRQRVSMAALVLVGERAWIEQRMARLQDVPGVEFDAQGRWLDSESTRRLEAQLNERNPSASGEERAATRTSAA